MRALWGPFSILTFPAGRPREEDPLTSSARRKILAAVRKEPGLTVLALAARADVPWGSIHYHLTRLKDAGLVSLLEDPLDARARRVYPAGREESSDAIERPPGLQGAIWRVAAAIAQHPGIGFEELAERTGRSPRTLQEHLRRLIDEGYVTSERPTRYRDLRPTGRLVRSFEGREGPQGFHKMGEKRGFR